MTLEEINKSDPSLRARIDSAFKTKDAVLFLDALEEDLLEGLVRSVKPQEGEEHSIAQVRWYSFLAGKRSVLKSIKDIGRPKPIQTTSEQLPLEHAIPQHLVEARMRNFQPVVPTHKAKKK